MADNFDFDFASEHGSAPYMFEPEYPDEELRLMDEQALQEAEENAAVGEQSLRSDDETVGWCRCGKKCERKPLHKECICCAEFYLWQPELSDDDAGEDQISPCITDNATFKSMLDLGILETFFLYPKINWNKRPKPAGENGHLSNE